ncbi:hypothetical protein MBAV_002287 [Candidatus Magnetobacterium bavaricum]|uniref:Uncharacterized protein n=1 Tax=Candidatus Magnetobacterium bavaricum TaxID=29290 RepID=A0A0F3GU86_9BACT|nr:hypothetical protein MBAV_002287 [Candidatus Magnetobacterium bavaricum]
MPLLMRSSISVLRYRSRRSMRVSTSVSGLLQFSIENAYSVRALMPISTPAFMTSLLRLTP